jgi:hypothetical protein
MNPTGIKSARKSIDWLLANASLPVQYLVRKNILFQNPGSPGMKALWSEVNRCDEVRRLFDLQKKDGSWCIGGPGRRYDPSEPKYKTTVWILPVLAEMGFTVRDPRIRKACNYILKSWVFKTPFFKNPISPASSLSGNPGFSQCRFNWYLIALASVGLADEPAVKKGFSLLLKRQRENGGWVMPGHIERRNGRSCPWSSYGSTMALYYSRNKAYKNALLKGLGFLISHLSGRKDSDIRKPYFRGHNLIRELLVISEFRQRLKAKPVKSLLTWLTSMYNKQDGSYSYSGKPASKWSAAVDGTSAQVAKYHLRHVVEKDWLTYHMTRILLNLQGKK